MLDSFSLSLSALNIFKFFWVAQAVILILYLYCAPTSILSAAAAEYHQISMLKAKGVARIYSFKLFFYSVCKAVTAAGERGTHGEKTWKREHL